MGKHDVSIAIKARDEASRIFGNIRKSMLAMAGAVGGFYAIKRAVSTTVSAAIEQEKAEQKLETAIQATGQSAGFTAEQLKDHAASLQSITTYGDESIIAMQSMLATFKSIKGDQFQAATMAILDLNEAMGKGFPG